MAPRYQDLQPNIMLTNRTLSSLQVLEVQEDSAIVRVLEDQIHPLEYSCLYPINYYSERENNGVVRIFQEKPIIKTTKERV